MRLYGNKRDRDYERERRSRVRRRILILFAVVGVFSLCAAIYSTYVKAPELAEEPAFTEEIVSGGNETDPKVSQSGRKEGFYTFLFCGTDDGNGNTDTIMVCSYDTVNGKLNVMSVPRDTMVNVSWGIKKINSAYGVGGVDRLKSELNKILGFSVDFYIAVDLEAFVKVVDTIGGVDFNVPVDMNYDDPTQDLHIHINKGLQPLSGEDALKVVRWRQNNDGSGYPEADIGRIRTQQEFLKVVFKKCVQIENVTKISEFAKIFEKYLDTDLTVGNMVWLGLKLKDMNMENINFFTMPSSTDGGYHLGQSYNLIDIEGLLGAVNEYLNPYTQEIKIGSLNILTKIDGRIYSTTGTIAGGADSFTDFRSSSSGSSGGTTETTAAPETSETPAPETSAEVTPSATPSASPEPSSAETPAATPTGTPSAEPTPSPAAT